MPYTEVWKTAWPLRMATSGCAAQGDPRAKGCCCPATSLGLVPHSHQTCSPSQACTPSAQIIIRCKHKVKRTGKQGHGISHAHGASSQLLQA